MRRRRLLLVLFPFLLLVLPVVVYQSWRPRPAAHTVPGYATQGGPRTSVLKFRDYQGAKKSLEGTVETLEEGEDGRLRLEGIRNLQFERPDREPLIVSAVRGQREGERGDQVWRFEEEVVFREADRGLQLSLPSLVIDETAGEARSEGEIRFAAPAVVGRASALVYGLRGQPGRLTDPRFEDEQGTELVADTARLLDGINDVELSGNVRIVRPTQTLSASRMRLLRDDAGRLQRAEAWGGVTGEERLPGGGSIEIRSQRLEARWDGEGHITRLWLSDDATVRHGGDRLVARRVDAERRPDGGWNLLATEDVVVDGRFGLEPGRLSTDRLDASLDPGRVLERAEARGHVRFEGGSTSAEAERVEYTADARLIELHGDAQRKARFAREKTRVAAEWIRTDDSGRDLVAERKVEASLLPGETSRRKGGLFTVDKAVHFVASRLETEDGGMRLKFSEDVRAWQSDRNLSGDEVTIDQSARRLEVHGRATTRVPRGGRDVESVSESDFVQVVADTLTYDDSSAVALYSGGAKIRMAEGWVDSELLEIRFDPATREIERVDGKGDVRLEVFARAKGEPLDQPLQGKADRLEYRPTEETLHLFGDRAPAEVRDPGGSGGTTQGRVLRYRLDQGTLEVDAGGQGPVRIRAPEEGASRNEPD